ncbi:hypothetical protein [Algibacter sp. 2305UL17-15]|uniref:hypothetical protein n=1 Tax=Algibacter sp. 2305UL17-15 TaxID=3231268 RepID=UPI003458C83D
MINYIKPFKFLLLILTLFFFFSCGVIVKSKANSYITEEKGAIPPEFGKQNSTVLFVTHHRSYNKYLKKNVVKIYKGNYEFVSIDELNSNDTYKDLSKYRYVFDYNYQSAGDQIIRNNVTNGDFSTTSLSFRPALYNVKKFMIIDRQEQQLYYCKLTSSYWSKLQKVYLKKMNEKLVE